MHFEHPEKLFTGFFLRGSWSLGTRDRIALFIEFWLLIGFLGALVFVVTSEGLLVTRAVPSSGSPHSWSGSRGTASTHVIPMHARSVTLLFWHRKKSRNQQRKKNPRARGNIDLEDPTKLCGLIASNTSWTSNNLPNANFAYWISTAMQISTEDLMND
jgi:hypothetical protein